MVEPTLSLVFRNRNGVFWEEGLTCIHVGTEMKIPFSIFSAAHPDWIRHAESHRNSWTSCVHVGSQLSWWVTLNSLRMCKPTNSHSLRAVSILFSLHLIPENKPYWKNVDAFIDRFNEVISSTVCVRVLFVGSWSTLEPTCITLLTYTTI